MGIGVLDGSCKADIDELLNDEVLDDGVTEDELLDDEVLDDEVLDDEVLDDEVTDDEVKDDEDPVPVWTIEDVVSVCVLWTELEVVVPAPSSCPGLLDLIGVTSASDAVVEVMVFVAEMSDGVKEELVVLELVSRCADECVRIVDEIMEELVTLEALLLVLLPAGLRNVEDVVSAAFGGVVDEELVLVELVLRGVCERVGLVSLTGYWEAVDLSIDDDEEVVVIEVNDGKVDVVVSSTGIIVKISGIVEVGIFKCTILETSFLAPLS